jgi:hypothetical protein
MALPKNVTIPKTSQFAKIQTGKNKFRILSDIVTGFEGWKDKKPFRHEGDTCMIKDNQVDLNQSGRPNINYFWAMAVWNYADKMVQVLQITQKTIMNPLYSLEQNEDWGDLKNYDIEITKSKDGDKTTYAILGIPPKPLSEEIVKAYEESDVDLKKLFAGEYPMPVEEDDKPVESTEDTPF